MDIAFSGDSNYFQHIGVALTSIRKHSKINLNVHLLCSSYDVENSQTLIKYCESIGIYLKIVEVDEHLFNGMPCTRRITKAAYYRLLLPELINSDKVLYLDGDIVVNHCLSNLWDIDMGDNLVAAVRDPGVSNNVAAKIGIPKEFYFNSGVMLLNLKAFKEENLSRRMISYAVDNPSSFTFHDQCILNKFCKSRWIELSPSWNYMSHNFIQPSNDAEKDIYILHYNSYYGKPWEKLCSHPLRNHYLEHLESTPWRGNFKSNPDYTTYIRRKIPLIEKILKTIRKHN